MSQVEYLVSKLQEKDEALKQCIKDYNSLVIENTRLKQRVKVLESRINNTAFSIILI